MSSAFSLGIDFGTTNTVVALADAAGPAHLVQFPAPEGELFAFRSCLSFHAPASSPTERAIAAGPWAIDAYVEDPAETRFIQSFKSFAASESFSETQILGRRYRFEDLLSTFLLKLRDYADAGMAELPQPGDRRPAGDLRRRRAQRAAGAVALRDRLRADGLLARSSTPTSRWARRSSSPASSTMTPPCWWATSAAAPRTSRSSASSAEAGEIRAIPLGRSGVGVAGDAFDYRIIDNLVSPALGKGSSYTSFGKVLPIPNRYYSAFARWDQLALMRASRDMREIRAPGARGRRAGEDRPPGRDAGRELRLPALPLGLAG